ncbi:MAG: cytochrome c [Stappiaceae bacterium]
MRTFIKTLLSIGLLAFFTGTAMSQDANEKAIKARQAVMQIYSFNLGQLGAMVKGEVDYDAELASIIAKDLLAAANMDNRAMWPQGSGEDAYPGKTRALPALWSTFPKVLEKQAALRTAAEKLAAEAGNGVEAIKANMGGVGGSCKGCHDDFRAEKK